jgi:hypothetical protein
MPSRFIQEFWGVIMFGRLLWTAASKKLAISAIAAGTVALLLAISLQAQPTGGRILSDITISGSAECKTARITFNFPIRYVAHFPQNEGNELRIQLKLLTVSPSQELDTLSREAFSPADDSALLNNVTYEGDTTGGGPYLSLQFSRTAHFTVAQGTDFRSMNVSFSDTAASCPGRSLSRP